MSQNNPDIDAFDPTAMDDQLQKELDEALGDKSVEDLMNEAEADEKAAAAPTEAASQGGDASESGSSGPGGAGAAPSGDGDVHLQLIRGRIHSLRDEDVFVELMGASGKHQGIVPLKQFDRPPRVGSIMDFIVDRVDEAEGLVHLNREGAVSHATWEQLAKGDLVEVRITGTNKGGLELALVGNIRGFMPASQIDLHHVDDLNQFVGQKLTGRVQDVDRKGKNVVVSRRAHLEVERKRLEKKAWETLEEGAMLQGTVTKLMEFGAFVDIGGVDGLLHVSDMSYSRVNKPEDVVKVGQKIEVKLLKLDPGKKRISLGLKQTQPDPWEAMAGQLEAGKEVEGKVVRIADFGAFVELSPGVDGLLPVSELAWTRVRHPSDVVKQGDAIRVRVLQVEPGKRRLTLSLKGMKDDPWMGAEARFPQNEVVEGEVISTTDFGAFVRIGDAIEGLVHISELSERRVNQVTDVLKVGQKESFRVLEIDEDERKVRLSLSQVKNPRPEGEQAGGGGRPGGDQGRGGRGGRRDHRGHGGQGGYGGGSREKVPSEYTAKAKAPKGKDLKGGMGNGGGMGSGLGDLKL